MQNETGPTLERDRPTDVIAPAVAVAGIARRFGDRWALRGISLRVAPGEIVALLGRNGSGKTTLLRVLSTALRPTRGTGTILGHDLVAGAAAIRGELGVLGHSPGLYGDLTAAENLGFALRMLGQPADPAIIQGALETVELARDANARVRGFSAGMQRRLALARLLIQRPRLVLLDEPYASFDASGVDLVNRYLTNHQQHGGTAIVATHDIARGSGVLGRVIELRDGQVLAGSGAAGAPGAAEPMASADRQAVLTSVGERVG